MTEGPKKIKFFRSTLNVIWSRTEITKAKRKETFFDTYCKLASEHAGIVTCKVSPVPGSQIVGMMWKWKAPENLKAGFSSSFQPRMAKVTLTGILLGGGAVRRETSGKARSRAKFSKQKGMEIKGCIIYGNWSVGRVAWVRSRIG